MNSKKPNEIKLKIPPAFVPDRWVCNHSKKRHVQNEDVTRIPNFKRNRKVHPQVSLSRDFTGKNFPKPLNTKLTSKKYPLISISEFNKRMEMKFERLRLLRRKRLKSDYSKTVLIPEYESLKHSIPKRRKKLKIYKFNRMKFRKSYSKKKSYRPFYTNRAKFKKNVRTIGGYPTKRFKSFIRKNKLLASKKRFIKKCPDYERLSEDNYQTIVSCSTHPQTSVNYETSFISDIGFFESPSLEIHTVNQSSLKSQSSDQNKEIQSFESSIVNSKKSSKISFGPLNCFKFKSLKSNSEKLASKYTPENRETRSQGDQPLNNDKIEYPKIGSERTNESKNQTNSKVNVKESSKIFDRSRIFDDSIKTGPTTSQTASKSTSFTVSNKLRDSTVSNFTSHTSFTNVSKDTKLKTNSLSESLTRKKLNQIFLTRKISTRHSFSTLDELNPKNSISKDENSKSLVNKFFSSFSQTRMNEKVKETNKKRMPLAGSKSSGNFPKSDTTQDKLKSNSDSNLCVKKNPRLTFNGNPKLSVISDERELFEEVPDNFWVESGKTKLGLQIDRLIRRYRKLTRQKKYLVFFIIVLLFFTTLSFLALFVMLILGPSSQYIIINSIGHNTTALSSTSSRIITTTFISTLTTKLTTTTSTTTTTMKKIGLVGDTCIRVIGDCSDHMECKKQGILAWNISTCQCKNGYVVDYNRTCKGLSESFCDSNAECSKNLFCNQKEKKCVCKEGYHPRPDGTCFAKYNSNCEADSDCLKNGECKSIGLDSNKSDIKVCRCSSKERTLYNPDFEPFRQCRLLIGAKCQENLDCIENARCNKYCSCRETDLFFETQNFLCEDACKNKIENLTINGIPQKFPHPRKCGYYFTCSPRDLDLCPSNYYFDSKTQFCNSSILCV